MAKTVVAKSTDTLCGIAIREGFLNCNPLRAQEANKAYRTRELLAGDKVFVPDLRKKEEGRPTTDTHRFKRKRWPEPSLRFVRGSKTRVAAADATLTFLNISNFVTNQAGTSGTAAFPNGYSFHADADADPDTFKVEVVSPDGGAKIKVLLEALKPVYKADGTVEKWELFSGAEYAARKNEVELVPTKSDAKRYRSRYLRLVSDEADAAAVPAQTLLVTTMSDGLAGERDKVEILDQHVRASYKLPGCKAAAPVCTVRAQLPVGEDRKRCRIAIHVFRVAPGGALVAGLTNRALRLRVLKWFRRAYAQANIAPKFDGPGIEVLDPPWANMIAIANPHGSRTLGLSAAGTTSTISFDLGGVSQGAVLDWFHDTSVTVNLKPNMTPKAVCDAINAALPAGYRGRVFPNARKFNDLDPSCDIVITKADGTITVVRNEATTDLVLAGAGNLAVARVNLVNVDDSDADSEPTTPELRKILRSGTSADTRIDYFVIDRFASTTLRGVSFLASTHLPADQRNPAPLRWAGIMACNTTSGKVMDASDNLPFTFPHEAGHVLHDRFHADAADPNGPTEMMSGGGTTAANAANATKRICDDPIQVNYSQYNPAQPTQGAVNKVKVAATKGMRTRGAQTLEGW